jgi:hypothetical protein
MKAILIDSTAQGFRVVEYNGNDDLRQLVGGWIELAYQWPETEDVLYVDEEGLLKEQRHFFRIDVRADPQPLAGKGVIVGRELYERDEATGEDKYLGTADPAITVEELTTHVRFLSREQFEAWGKANASDPFVSLHTVDHNGVIDTTVLERTGSIVGYSRPKN